MYYAALILGLFGSAHCLAMCGPLILAFSKQMSSFKLKLLQQSGRLLGYVVLGFFMGLIGNTLIVFSIQQKISLVIGLLLIALTFYTMFRSKGSNLPNPKWLTKIQGYLLQNTSNKNLKFFSLGLVNAFLPCGLLFIALGSAVTMASPIKAMTYMMVFGLGTFPSLFLVAIMGNRIMGVFTGYQKKLVPVLTLTMGLFLAVRGMGLGIPYLSPNYNVATENVECCDHSQTSTSAMCGSLPK